MMISNYDEIFVGDSREYQILINAVQCVKEIEGITCEIGVFRGGSSKIILDTLRMTAQQKTHVAIDPYGSIDYKHYENITEMTSPIHP